MGVRAIALAFTAGASVLQCQSVLPSAGAAVIGAVVALLVACLALRAREPARAWRCLALPVVVVASCAVGFCWAALTAGIRLSDALADGWEGRDVRVTGVVATMPQPGVRGSRFEFDVEHVAPAAAVVPRRILLNWYAVPRPGMSAVAPPVVAAGERWQFLVRLRRPHGHANPAGFDYEAWLLERGIRATGYVRPGGTPLRLDPLVHAPAYWIERQRGRLRDRLVGDDPAAPYRGVLAALAIGDQRAIPASQWTVFTRTGVNHLMSISGLHITMLSSLTVAVVGRLWRRSQRLSARVPAPRAAIAAGLLVAWSYGVLSGFAVPAQRTVFMLTVVGIALLVGRRGSASLLLAWALLIVVLLDPWAAMAAGFWLSFGAVAVILFATSCRVRAPGCIRAFVQVQWVVTIGLVPALLAWFQQVSLVSPLANAVAVPVVSLVVVPLVLAGLLTPFDVPIVVAHWLVRVLMGFLEFLASWPDAVWQQHAPPGWAIVMAACGIAWLLLPRGIPGRWAGAAALLPLFVAVPDRPPVGTFELAVLDVGQGLAAVIRTADHALVYDAGPTYGPDSDAGARIVVPYLRAAGIRRVDVVMITHADKDHSGGALSVLASVPVGWLASSLPQDHAAHAAARRSIPCIAGQGWIWDGVRFDVLHPAPGHEAITRLRANDRSCVVRVASAYGTVLLTGDIEARSEMELVERSGAALRAEVLVVPHHGSTTSSTPAFVAAVNPDIAVFTTGYRNRFGHPRPEVLGRYEAVESRIYRTDRDGAIRMRVGPLAGIAVTAERAERRRYWQQPPLDLEPSLDGLYD
jgi:competence protein ComEC